MTAQSIPLSFLIGVEPSVLGAGGNPLELAGVLETQDTSIPIGTVAGFGGLQDVQNWFGVDSPEAALAAIYFKGYANGTLLPGLLWFMQYNTAAVGGYVRGGSLAGMSLTQLQALSGTLVTTTDGVASTSLAINLSSATSFSNAATLIETGIQGGTPSSTATVTYDALRQAFVIHSPTTGASSTEAFVSGSLAAGLKLTQAAGAVVSIGAAVQTPAGAVAALVAATQNWATLSTVWEPSDDDKVAFATAISAQGEKYIYVGWDTTATPADPASFAARTATLDGRVAVWGLDTGDLYPVSANGVTTFLPMPANAGAVAKALFFMGATASINFEETNGRLDYSYQKQAGLIPDVYDVTLAGQLETAGYNYYGFFASGASEFQNFQRGQISGTWKWADAYVDQIQMSSDFQVTLAQYREAVKAVPYAQRGYNGLRSTLMDPTKKHVNFGSIVAGVTLSQSQRQEVNTEAGFNIADTLQAQGWYLFIGDASPDVRAARGSPPMKFWYTDGGSIQRINLAAIDVQ